MAGLITCNFHFGNLLRTCWIICLKRTLGWKGLRSFLLKDIGLSVIFQFLPSSLPVPSQFHPSYFPKLIRAKVHGGNSEGRLHWYKMSFLKSIIKQNAVYQSNFQMSRQCLQRSDVFYLTLQRFTVSTYIGDGLQSEDFQTFFQRVCQKHLQIFHIST